MSLTVFQRNFGVSYCSVFPIQNFNICNFAGIERAMLNSVHIINFKPDSFASQIHILAEVCIYLFLRKVDSVLLKSFLQRVYCCLSPQRDSGEEEKSSY